MARGRRESGMGAAGLGEGGGAGVEADDVEGVLGEA